MQEDVAGRIRSLTHLVGNTLQRVCRTCFDPSGWLAARDEPAAG